jgi:hypothetical protein
MIRTRYFAEFGHHLSIPHRSLEDILDTLASFQPCCWWPGSSSGVVLIGFAVERTASYHSTGRPPALPWDWNRAAARLEEQRGGPHDREKAVREIHVCWTMKPRRWWWSEVGSALQPAHAPFQIQQQVIFMLPFSLFVSDSEFSSSICSSLIQSCRVFHFHLDQAPDPQFSSIAAGRDTSQLQAKRAWPHASLNTPCVDESLQ